MASAAAASGQVTGAVPLTERVLARLGRPRRLWMLLWAAVPLLSPVVFGSAIRLSGQPLDGGAFLDLVATQVGLAYACLVLLWGVGLLSRGAAAQRALVGRIAPATAVSDVFRGLGSTAAPVLLTLLVAAVTSLGGALRYGALPPLAALPFLLVYLLPIMTFMWVAVVVLAGLDRIGRQSLSLDTFPEDRTLGLGPLGSLASTTLLVLIAAAAPVMLVGSDEPVTLGVSLGIVGIVLAAFVLSMWRLHRQMAAARAHHLELARRLYAEAYRPLASDASLEGLRSQSSALGAAQALTERAEGLPTWPIDDATARFTGAVVIGVVTSLVVRGLFGAIGF
jgi:hypothetical protein